MKVKGMITQVKEAPDNQLEVTVTGSGKHYYAGGSKNVHFSLNMLLDRSLVKDYALGEFFEISVEKA